MARRLAHFSDPRLDAQIGELIKKHKELQKDIEQLEQRLKKTMGVLADSRIVEYGSNENGYYVKWSNGLGLCWVKTTKQLETASNQRYPMPISFDSSYPVTGGFSISSGYIMNSDASKWVGRRTVLDSLYVAAFGSDGSADGYPRNHWNLRNNEALGSAYDLPVTLWAIGWWY